VLIPRTPGSLIRRPQAAPLGALGQIPKIREEIEK
jgi:hypothetical protein